jgi:hypothetical protein
MQRPDKDENEEKQKNRGAEREKHSPRQGPSLKVRTFAQSSFGDHWLIHFNPGRKMMCAPLAESSSARLARNHPQ